MSEGENISIVKQFLYDVQQKWGQSDIYRETPIRYLGKVIFLLLI